MAAASPSTVESLILKATNPLNKDEDPNVMQSICQAVTNEEGGIRTALRLIIHKIQSPQEKEALQALLILQSCVNNCGSSFHAEIGKFRFLNEMIKLVSPKYLGNETSAPIKKKVLELLYTWTVDLTDETKIAEAYQMLKDQKIVKEDPHYSGLPAKPVQKARTSGTFEDEEKSRVLQKLLQSKRPEDILKANALIKNMVKEDERRMERSSRRAIEVETAMNNVSVLDEMLSQFEQSQTGSEADFDVMSELFSSCSNLQTNIYRLVADIDDKEEGIGDILKANDELTCVMGRYKLVIEERKTKNIGEKTSKNVKKEDSLLDLSSPEKERNNLESSTLEKLGIQDLNLQDNITSVPTERKSVESILDNLSVNLLSVTEPSDISTVPNAEILLPEKPVLSKTSSEPLTSVGRPKPLEDLDILGSSLLRKSLPPNVHSLGSQFKPQEKVSLNQMRSQIISPALPVANTSSKPLINENSSIINLSNNLLSSTSSLVSNETCSESLLNTDLSSFLTTTNSKMTFQPNITTQSNGVTSSNDMTNDSLLLDISPEGKTDTTTTSVTTDTVNQSLDNHKKNEAELSSSMQLSDVKSLADVHVSLDAIKPGKQSSIKLIEENFISLTLHFTENKPRDDVSVIVVSVTSHNTKPFSNYILQAVVRKGCKVKLQSPSSTDMQGFSPFLPAPAITQIMLIANPNQLNVSLKVMLSYTIDDDLITAMGEVSSLPL